VATRLTVGWQGCGESAFPGPGHRAGPQHSRSTPLSPRIFADVTEQSELRAGIMYAESGRDDPDVISPETLVVDSLAEIAKLRSLESPYARRVSALVDAAATLLYAWARALEPQTRIAQLTLTAHAFMPQPRHSPFSRCAPVVKPAQSVRAYATARTTAAQDERGVAVAQDEHVAAVAQDERGTAAAQDEREDELAPPSSLATVEQPLWACPVCTFRNQSARRRCEMCETCQPPRAQSSVAAVDVPLAGQAAGSKRLAQQQATSTNGIERYLQRRRMDSTP